ncbi:hypothetical protein [Streptomyces subrutilus]|uniref:hypothetical protein n=1 Tax=Streptomyces subrutilus TaxID=36818 RepID=UPI00340C15D8
MPTRSIEAAAWDAALLRLLEDVFTFARSGPRLHEDWAEDVLAVMERSVDPRGWFAQDSETFQEGWEAGCPAYPFRVTAAGDLRAGLRPITAGAAVELLASLSQKATTPWPRRNSAWRSTRPSRSRTGRGSWRWRRL